MFLEFLGQNVAFGSADSDTDATVTRSRMVWSCQLVFRGTDVDLSSEFLILTINCNISIIKYWLLPPPQKKFVVPIPSIWVELGNL